VRHAISGRSAHATSRAELLHYFRVQEHEKISVAYNSSARFKARIKELKNNQAHHKGQAREAIKAKPAGSSNGHHAGYVKNKMTGGKIGGKSVSQTDKCPIHPDGKHKWGDCFQNILNKKPPAKGSFSKKGKSASTTHEVNLMDIDPPSEEAINDIDLSRDECIVLDVSGSNFPDTSDECKECDLDGKSNTFATLTSAKAMMTARKGKSFDSIQALVSLDESVTHHLDEILLTADQQDTNRQVLSNEFLNVFTHYIDELYSTGDSDVKLNISKHEIQSSRLRSSSIAIVGSIQQTKVNILLKVLFDSGSDKTIFKKSSLPQDIEPSTGKKRKVSGMNASSVIDQYVMLKDITLPEFSSSQRIPGPIRALIMPMDAQYDLIIGMDVMQVI
jgi:hypothetical protein